MVSVAVESLRIINPTLLVFELIKSWDAVDAALFDLVDVSEVLATCPRPCRKPHGLPVVGSPITETGTSQMPKRLKYTLGKPPVPYSVMRQPTPDAKGVPWLLVLIIGLLDVPIGSKSVPSVRMTF